MQSVSRFRLCKSPVRLSNSYVKCSEIRFGDRKRFIAREGHRRVGKLRSSRPSERARSAKAVIATCIIERPNMGPKAARRLKATNSRRPDVRWREKRRSRSARRGYLPEGTDTSISGTWLEMKFEHRHISIRTGSVMALLSLIAIFATNEASRDCR
jgi:hypothetical protein